MAVSETPPNLQVAQATPGVVRISLSGNWRGESRLPGAEIIRQSLSKSNGEKFLEFDVADLTGWDSRLVAFINRCVGLCRDRNIEFRSEGLPEGVRRLLRLANAVPKKKDTGSEA